MKWSSATLDPLKLLLDVENPRIDLPYNATQNQIRLQLLQTEDVADLAKKLINAGGLLAGERIIVTQEDGRHVVLEGNRRTCACQLLLDPKLIPTEFRGRFPRTSDSEFKSSISAVLCDVAPNREAAEFTITQRHTQPGIMQWVPAAQYRRVQRLLSNGRNIDQIAQEFGLKRADVLKILRQGSLLTTVQNLPVWSDEDRHILRANDLKTNPFTRFFTLKGVRGTLGLHFDENDGTPHSSLDTEVFHRILEQLARELLLPEPISGKPRSNTRATPEQVFSSIADRDPHLGAILKPASADKPPATDGVPAGPTPSTWPSPGDRPSKPTVAKDPGMTTGTPRRKIRAAPFNFFEGLQCSVNDVYLQGFADEISRINYKSYPRSAAFLARALVEQTLIWSIKKVGLYGQLMQSLSANREPKVSELITFCITNQAQIFKRNPTRVLNQWINTHKDYCDLIVHGRWIIARSEVLEHLASETRGFIEEVLNSDLVR